ncbi:MAG: hypothetical protein IT168_19005 [Bryobacterales bacterium]|nr:hypothetical protein [Bryobacterales bacterium]
MRLRQLSAVFRLEIGKSFLSRRGLWIYILALLPVLIFGGHALIEKRRQEQRHSHAMASLTRDAVAKVKPGMTRAEVVAVLQQPWRHFSRHDRRGDWEVLQYTDGQTEWNIRLHNGQVDRINSQTGCDLAEDIRIFAGVFQFFYLRLAIFFGCVFVFVNLFRGEILEKSLHYYFLAPVRREIVVLGKFLAGVAATSIVFVTSTALQLALLYGHLDSATRGGHFALGNGWHDVLVYLAVTALACAGYGSVFLAAGVLIRNPLIPAAVILLWESINGILPAALAKISVIYYLKSLCPVEIPVSGGVPPPLALLALNIDPAPAWLAVAGLFSVTTALVAIAALRARRMEISYAAD